MDSKNSQTTPATTSTSSKRQLLGAADTQTAHHAASSTVPTRQLLGSANAETTPARAPAATADRKQRPDATCEGRTGECPGPRKETTRRNVTQGGGGSQLRVGNFAFQIGREISHTKPRGFRKIGPCGPAPPSLHSPTHHNISGSFREIYPGELELARIPPPPFARPIRFIRSAGDSSSRQQGGQGMERQDRVRAVGVPVPCPVNSSIHRPCPQ